MRQGVADFGQAAAHTFAGAGEALHQVVATVGDEADHAVAGFSEGRRDGVATVAERRSDGVAARVEGTGHPFAGAGHRGDDAFCRAIELLRQVLVRPGDRAANALRIGDDGFALCDELVDEGADADLVVGIGPFQGRDLAANQGFQLTGTGERPLDAVAHGRDLAADRLRHGEDGIGGEVLGFGEADRDFADGAGHEAHLLRTDGEHRHDREQDDGADDGGGADGGLKRRHSGEEALQLTPRLVPGEGEEGGEPDSGDDRGDDVGRAGRPHAQGLLQDADVLAVVIGHHGAVRRQQTSFAARPVAVRRRQVGSEGLVEIEARGARGGHPARSADRCRPHREAAARPGAPPPASRGSPG